jgi:hypothetical protein
MQSAFYHSITPLRLLQRSFPKNDCCLVRAFIYMYRGLTCTDVKRVNHEQSFQVWIRISFYLGGFQGEITGHLLERLPNKCPSSAHAQYNLYFIHENCTSFGCRHEFIAAYNNNNKLTFFFLWLQFTCGTWTASWGRHCARRWKSATRRWRTKPCNSQNGRSVMMCLWRKRRSKPAGDLIARFGTPFQPQQYNLGIEQAARPINI